MEDRNTFEIHRTLVRKSLSAPGFDAQQVKRLDNYRKVPFPLAGGVSQSAIAYVKH